MSAVISTPVETSSLRHDWSRAEVEALFELPFTELVFRAAGVHRAYFDPTEVQVSTLLSVKTGGCPEDCGYCPQSSHHPDSVAATKLMDIDAVVEKAKQAKAAGASRFCMGAAWRSPKPRDMPKVAEMIREVKALGLETCATLGMLSEEQAKELKNAGLDYYNHNLDTDPEYYDQIIHTRTVQDRFDTLEHVRDAGLKTCCGGIVGMGETRRQRAGLLVTLANLPAHPDSVPINRLVAVKGTPLANAPALDPFEFVRTIAVARILMPKSMVRLSAGRETMSDELQALCFTAGANSIFHGEKLLTTGNPDTEYDRALFQRLGLRPMSVQETHLNDLPGLTIVGNDGGCGSSGGCGCSGGQTATLTIVNAPAEGGCGGGGGCGCSSGAPAGGVTLADAMAQRQPEDGCGCGCSGC
ncbi:MAG: biotin synthase BioB [Thermomonas sp.]|uniref:biotin synthase BioB n=1 Tax=Thermomonas sp. TaxID=1971895 RepID=UPI001ECD2549|nr:biotin synthase BioB [Thermomonas sp.]